MISFTKAIVLNSYKYSETSLICNLFSKDYGKLNIIAKGARSIKNPNKSILQPMHYIDLHYYYKPKRNIQLLKEASINNHFYYIKKNYNKLVYSYSIIELINKTIPIEKTSDIIFRLTHKVLSKINHGSNAFINIYFIFFQLQLLKFLGFQPVINQCIICNLKLNDALFNNYIGQLCCLNCKDDNSQLSINNESLNIICFLSTTHIDKIEKKYNFNINLKNVNQFLFQYVSHHIVNINQLKTIKLLNK